MEIQKLDELLSPYVKGDIVDKKITRLTAPGENYAGLLLKVDVTVKNGNKEKVFHAVAKCVPPKEQMQGPFDFKNTFKYEMGWYAEAIPALIQFQKDKAVEHVADYFMKLYAARVSVDPKSDTVDDTAVMLMENLVERGFKNADRIIGFNLIQSKEILKKLANFHATTIALQIENPKKFNDKIKKFCSVKEKKKAGDPLKIFEPVLTYLKENPETAAQADLVRKIMGTPKRDHTSNPNSPWVTAVHTDFWSNNMMISDDSPPNVIILDLQTCGYESAIGDLIFFLGTSLEKSVSDKHFDELLKVYYEEFVRTLKELKVEVVKLSEYSWESFEAELKEQAKIQLGHVMFFIPIVTAPKDAVNDPTKGDGLKRMFLNITQAQKDKFSGFAKNWGRHNWLN